MTDKNHEPKHLHDVHDGHSHHSGDHHHEHSHHPTPNAENSKQLRRVFVLTLGFMGVEILGGLYTNSLALLSDAAHMLTDAAALGMSLFAFYVSSRPATDKKTYGYHRLEILSAFVNGIFLVFIAFGILMSAWERFHNPSPILAPEMFWISLGGLGFNLLGAYFITRGDHNHLNMRGALFHVLGDALGSLGAVIAAVLIYFLGWTQADPIVSAFISVIIVASAFRLIFDTAHVIMEGTPHHLDLDEIRRAIGQVTHIKEVHDLHVWSITSGMVSLTAHVVAEPASRHSILVEIRTLLQKRFQIEHVTIQIEDESLAPNEPSI